jgi:hypothetical protein
MTADPWTDPDPQPGDFDADLATLDRRYVDLAEGAPEAKLIVLVGVEAEDAERSSASPTLAARPRPMSSRSSSAALMRHAPSSPRSRVVILII